MNMMHSLIRPLRGLLLLSSLPILVLTSTVAFASTVSGLPPVNEAEALRLTRLATCRDSWLGWQDDERGMTNYIGQFDADYTHGNDDATFLPKAPSRVLGFPLMKVYPQSVGLGIGFSVELAGTLAQVRTEVEKQLGKSLECDASDGMTSCGLELAPSKTVTLAADGNGTGKSSLLGCFYIYEK